MLILIAGALVAVSDSYADSNASGGVIQNSESLVFSGGPFDLVGGSGFGDSGNGTFSGSFSGGFTANRLLWSGTQTSLIDGTWADDAFLYMTDPGGMEPTFRINPGFATYDGQTIGFSGLFSSIVSVYPMGIDPAGDWEFEFGDISDDGPGVDQTVDSFTLTFDEVIPFSDTSGNFSLGTSSIGSVNSAVGELAVFDIFDTYTLTLAERGLFSVELFSDPMGYTGDDLDSEIGLFDSAGNLIANNDDAAPGNLFSALTNLDLEAGDYTLVVSGWETDWSSGTLAGVVPGSATGDYALNATLNAIPEPSSLLLLGFIGSAGFTRRRR